ncbi:MSEP-CTERM sorting domain-containing protein [Pedobacter chinensis]|uniref:MSEP-CTERM sorting domain-containing protein n=1 Tax=Pedobacter chinensis TaxID=2282421 RepID=A0A369Q7N7_9SPHI|nr:MSEP-CTERM sorting domain-containing protein [Pedobacter chinensis]RDC58298.1 MSEP-CTERM sorting domain-containing protein [Pedobacter chinensis]
MKNLLNPKWIIAINIIPSIILIALLYGQLNVIESLLDKNALTMWKDFSICLIVATILQIIYTVFCIIKDLNISGYYAVFTLIIYSVIIYFFGQNSEYLIPFSVPRWMINIDPFYYSGTFLMSSLIHSLFILVVLSSRKSNTTSAGLSFLYGICIPLLGYIFIQVVLPLWQNTESNFSTHVLIVLFLSASILFLFFICRGFYILTTKTSSTLLKFKIYLKIVICIVFPILGLLINNSVFKIKYGVGNEPFGNFSNAWFYIVTVFNGILICLYKIKNENFRLFRFYALLACYPNTLYFFFVFAPFLPLAIVAVIAMGIGFLMLTPLALFTLQTNDLHKEYHNLKQSNSAFKLKTIGTVAFLVLPIFITVSYWKDKLVLNNALEYIYSPDYSKDYRIDVKSLFKTLEVIKQNKTKRRISDNQNTPFLTPYYNWLVLDNMVLSDQKITKLEEVFGGYKNELEPQSRSFSNRAKISKIKATSKFDSHEKVWRSIIDLELTNPSDEDLDSYETVFNLPNGCWVSNYYLNIGNRKEYGILAEKKSALWVFSQIRNENRDPGILYYLSGNDVAFKIFPFGSKEIRKSGIELIHKEPITFKIDDKSIDLGNKLQIAAGKIESINGTTYIPAREKAKLKLVKRIPQYHFLIDVSQGQERHKENYYNRITQFIKTKGIKSDQIKIDFVNALLNEIPYHSKWKNELVEQDFNGGFYVEGAIKKILAQHYNTNNNTFPVMIIVSDDSKIGILTQNFADFKLAFPESNFFYELDRENNLWSHSLENNPKNRIEKVSKITNHGTRVWKNKTNYHCYLSNDDQASIAINSKLIENDFAVEKQKTWAAGLNLQGMWFNGFINKSFSNENHLNMIKQSIISGILSPTTSYLVVENEAQKMALKQKQAQILSGNKNLDPDEETQRMDEPNLYLLLLLILLVFKFKKNLTFLSLATK